MARIHRLPPAVITTIAAGEVIERPAYVVKELVENSLDAGATTIDISFSQAGLERISIYDDGRGMEPEDLALSILAHHTSKISETDDLLKLSTFGFRGEALASIGAVSQMTITSRPEGSEMGHSLYVDNGYVGEVVPKGMATGTHVVVENLFQRVPVRKKFLTNVQREREHISDVVTRIALAHPQVAFSLTGHRPLFQLPKDESFEARLARLFSEETLELLIPITYEHSFIKIEGYIGKPQLARKQNKHQFVFINHRPVAHPVLSTVLRKAYGSLLPPGLSPWFALNITLPSGLVDQNVHPRKETVAFIDESQVIALINNAVVDTLTSQDISFHYQPKSPKPLQLHDKHSPLPELHKSLRETVVPWSVTPAISNKIIQLDQTYLVVPEVDGFALIDQHAAHERILYEQFLAAFSAKNESPSSIKLDPALTINLSLHDSDQWLANADTLRSIGFTWEEFGPNSYQVTAIPEQLSEHDVASIIPQLLDDLTANAPIELTEQTHRTLAYLACRSAVMAGDPLSQEQAERLVRQLADTPNNATCPHGRPTRIHFGIEQLEKMFKRV